MLLGLTFANAAIGTGLAVLTGLSLLTIAVMAVEVIRGD